MLKPDLYFASVHSIDLADLRRRGVRALLVDLDNTLLPRDATLIPEGLAAWARRLGEEGFAVCLVSNNWHSHVPVVAAELGFHAVHRAIKPLPWAFRRAMRVLGSSPGETAVVGDQVFTDVLGGNLLGLTTVLVQPLSRTDLPHTLLLRLIERAVLADRQPLQ